jgi:predicted solute-binding protein
MSEIVMKKHIEFYVNDYSKALGASGRQAIHHLLTVTDVKLSDKIEKSELFVPAEVD